MSSFPQLDARNASWDKFRGAVVMPAGVNQVAISIEALESWANRKLNAEDAVEVAVDDKAMFAAIANTLSANDHVITITAGILNSRSWSVAEHIDDGPEDSGPIYLDESDAERGEHL